MTTWCIAALVASRGVAMPTEAFIRANYVQDDPRGLETGYARLPVHRFRQAWTSESHDLHAIGDAVDQIVRCVPALSPYRDELSATERVRLQSGEELIAFHLYRGATRAHQEPLFLSSVVTIDGERCVSLPYRPVVIDLDYGGRTREPWDLFVFRGTRFLLVSVHQYEARGFELFRVEDGRLKRVREFWYAFLGGG